MRFVKALRAYVASLADGRGEPSFSVGEWLATLHAEQIDALGVLVEKSRARNGSDENDELATVALIAATAEGRMGASAAPAAMNGANHLRMLISIESLARRNLIEVSSPLLTMDPSLRVVFRLTDDGHAVAQQVAAMDP